MIGRSTMSKNSNGLEAAYLINKLKRPGITSTDLYETIIECLYKIGDFLTATEKLLTWDIKNFSLYDILKTNSTFLLPFLRQFFELARKIICERSDILDTKVTITQTMRLLVFKTIK
jgi:hypothetical protein